MKLLFNKIRPIINLNSKSKNQGWFNFRNSKSFQFSKPTIFIVISTSENHIESISIWQNEEKIILDFLYKVNVFGKKYEHGIQYIYTLYITYSPYKFDQGVWQKAIKQCQSNHYILYIFKIVSCKCWLFIQCHLFLCVLYLCIIPALDLDKAILEPLPFKYM